MKHTIIALSLLVSGLASAECDFKESPLAGKAYVVPVYKADVHYVFNGRTQNAFAKVHWSLDVESTKECFQVGKEKYGPYKVVIPTVRLNTNLTVRVLGSDADHPMRVFQEATGHWNGMPGIIKIPYSLRSEIESAVKNGEKVIEVLGDTHFRMTSVERRNIGQVDCTEKEEEAGVLSLFKRFNIVKQKIEQRDYKEAVNLEEVMQDFLGTCVVFERVEANSLVEFDNAHRLNSKLVKGHFSFKGNVIREIAQPMPALSVQKISILDI